MTDTKVELLQNEKEITSDRDTQNTTGRNEPDEDSSEALPLIAQLSALLFVSPKSLRIEALRKATDAAEDEILSALELLAESYDTEVHGIELKEINGGWALRSSPRAARVIKRLIPPKAKQLSKAAAETLAVVAYKQPVHKADIEAIRGVDALPTLKTLLDAKLIKAIGREDTIGNPTLYGTTQTFLEKFGLRDLSQLPSIHDLEELEADPGEVEEVDYPADSAMEQEVHASGQ